MTTLMTNPYVLAFAKDVGRVDLDPGVRLAQLERRPSGLRNLDQLLHGGLPMGHVTGLVGADDCGKSTLALHFLGELGGVYVDCDGHFDPAYARRIGTRPLLANTVELRAVEDVVCSFLMAGELVVVDSLASVVLPDLSPCEFKCVISSWQARARAGGGALLLIDQLRYRRGVGAHERASMAIAEYYSLRLLAGPASSGTDVVVTRDVHHPGSRSAHLDFDPDRGFSRAGAWLDAAVESGEVLKSGSWYTWPDGEIIAQGRAAAKEALRDRC
jgi:hypothetical protein